MAVKCQHKNVLNKQASKQKRGHFKIFGSAL